MMMTASERAYWNICVYPIGKLSRCPRLGPGVDHVPANSPLRIRRIVERFAQFFRREFHYDFVQYSATERYSTENTRPFLFSNHSYFFGGGCFRWRDYTNAPHGWALQWIWLHPYFRHEGHLSAAWDSFESAFPQFYVEPPLSHSIEQFLKSRNRVAAPLMRSEMPQ